MAIEILIVDDEESLRGIISQVLEEDGFVVREAASGEEALDIFSNAPYPIIFTDIRMAGISGLQLLQQIKQSHPETQVIIITSNASVDSAVTALRAGAYDFLMKPFDDLDLISAVARRAAEKIELVRENSRLISQLTEKNNELEANNNVLSEMANRDGLSGLYNHRYFQEALEKEAARAHRHNHSFSLFFIDIDFFKNFNDTNGHPAGDVIIRTIGKILSESLRDSDMVARYGGEEFTAILPETDRNSAVALAEKLRLRIAEFPFSGREKQPGGLLSVSIGVAVFPEHGPEPKDILAQADQALYSAKKGGRNRVCCLPNSIG